MLLDPSHPLLLLSGECFHSHRLTVGVDVCCTQQRCFLICKHSPVYLKKPLQMFSLQSYTTMTGVMMMVCYFACFSRGGITLCELNADQCSHVVTNATSVAYSSLFVSRRSERGSE